jgi:hypothetical protein
MSNKKNCSKFGIWKLWNEVVVDCSKYYFRIFHEILKKTVNIHSMTSQSLDQNSSAGYREYKTV